MRENTMWDWMRQLDRLLRGESTRLSALRQGVIELPENGLSMVILMLGLLYGLCMGCFALFNKPLGDALLQMLSSTAKVPALFFTTLLVTFPSLYVFNALVGSRLTLSSVWRLLIAMMAVMMAVLASLGPIVAFFSVSTTNYSFMLVLNVAVFSLSGFLGLKFLLHTLHRLSVVLKESVEKPAMTPSAATASTELARPTDCALSEAQWQQTVMAARQAIAQGRATHWVARTASPYHSVATSDPSGALERMPDRMLGSDVMTVFYIWIVVFGLVGAQMSWLLRPFISAPDRAFVLFSPRESNFYTAVWDALMRLIS